MRNPDSKFDNCRSPIEAYIVYILLTIIGLASAPLQFTSNRQVVSIEGDLIGEQGAYSDDFTLASRLFNLVLTVVFLIIAKRIFNDRIYITSSISKLFIALALYLISNFFIGAVFGSFPGLAEAPYLTLGIVALMFLMLIKDVSPERLIATYRNIAVIMLVGTLFMGVFFPDLAYVEDSFSFEFSGSKRLVGLFNVPRQIGICALLLLAVELKRRVSGWMHGVIISICWAALIMSVSKTAIALAVPLTLWHFGRKGTIYGIILLFFGLIGFILFNDASVFESNSNFSTLTGRTELWEMVINLWLENPFFGNGPFYFSGSKIPYLAHAHNLFLQSLSDGGIFGVFGLAAYLAALLNMGIKNSKYSDTLSIWLVLLLVIFSMLEPIMRIDSFLDGPFFVNAFVILYLCSLDRIRTLS